MKVAYIGIKGLPAKAGVDRVVEAIATRMPSLGITPTIYCDRDCTLEDISFPGVELKRISSLRGKYFHAPTGFINAALHAVISGKYDIIHLHNIEASFVLPILRIKYPVVSTAHGFAYWREKWAPSAKWLIRMMDWPFMKFSNVTTFVSRKDADEFSKRFGQHTVYIPNGVGFEYQPDLNRAKTILNQHGLKPDSYFIFVAGRIEPTKGAHLAIEAVNRLEAEIPLLVVGDDQQIPAYGKKLKEIAGTKIRFHPLVNDAGALFGLLACAKCLLFPSFAEAMSMVLLEAASVGLPVICSDLAENRQVMENDALYFNSGNVESLIEQIQISLDRPSWIKEMGQRAMKRIREDYSWDAISVQYAGIYKDIITGMKKSGS